MTSSRRHRSELDRYFGLTVRGTTARVEVLAGTSTFFALSYIFVVNPAILAQGGFNESAVLFATISVSATATLAMGLWARLPFAVAPGMEMNAYVSFYVIGSLGYSWEQALGLVFWSSVAMLLVTWSGLRERIIASLPDGMKIGLATSVGVFLVVIALRLTGVIEYRGIRFTNFSTPFTRPMLVLLVSLAVIVVLEWRRVPGAVLLSIAVATLCAHAMGLGAPRAAADLSQGLSAIGRLDLGAGGLLSGLSVVLVLFLLDFYGSLAKLIGLTRNTSVLVEGRVPRLTEALTIDGMGSLAGSVVGTSSLTTFVESAVGIGAGGRTGLTAVVCAGWMVACLAIVPLLHLVPLIATAGALVFVGVKLCPSLRSFRQTAAVDRIAMAAMAITTLTTFALDRGMLAGFVVYLVNAAWRRTWPDKFLVLSGVLLTLGVVLQ